MDWDRMMLSAVREVLGDMELRASDDAREALARAIAEMALATIRQWVYWRDTNDPECVVSWE
jgi:histone H3/H4